MFLKLYTVIVKCSNQRAVVDDCWAKQTHQVLPSRSLVQPGKLWSCLLLISLGLMFTWTWAM